MRSFKARIEPALESDPGYPLARDTHADIVDRLRDLSVEADLDAARIYMQNHNWSRAAELLTELRDKAGTQTEGLINLLLDACRILDDTGIAPAPAIDTALEQLFENEAAAAARTLLNDAPHDNERALQWQIAERISSHIPEVLLLRPNLYRLNNALRQIAIEGYSVEEVRAIMGEIERTLDTLSSSSLDLPALRDTYRSVVEQLNALNPLLQTFSIQHQFPNAQLPLSSLERSLNAAMALADSMHVIGKQATSSPRDALNALDMSRSIDPTAPVWDDLEEFLNQLYDRLQACQTYVPAADGSDLEGWLETTDNRLTPFTKRLFDDMLSRMVNGIERALEAWRSYQQQILQGNREAVLEALTEASEAVGTISPALSTWFGQLRSVVDGANYIERHALPGGLGRALADGWRDFDRGQLAEAERLAQRALEIARNDDAQHAAKRLLTLSRISREWTERNGINSQERTRSTLNTANDLFTDTEQAMLSNFESQMPSLDTYLKAMNRGIVAAFERRSSPGLRVLYVYYVLQGAMAIHDDHLDEGQQWRDAAIKTLPERGARHIVARTLDEYLTRRRDLDDAKAIFQQINGKQVLPELESMRRQLENNAQARLLASGIQSLRDLEVALREWTDADFRAAGLRLDEAVKGLSEVEQAAGLNLDGYRAWLMDLMQAAADLLVQAREMRQTIEKRPDAPEKTVPRVLNNQVRVTETLLGAEYAATMRQWRDTYQQFVNVLQSDERRSKRLERLNELFRAMFIDRHPPYPLYQHWYNRLEAQSEFAAPPTDEPAPRIQTDIQPYTFSEASETGNASPADTSDTQPPQPPADSDDAQSGSGRGRDSTGSSGFQRIFLSVLALVILGGVVVIALGVLNSDSSALPDTVALTETAVIVAAARTDNPPTGVPTVVMATTAAPVPATDTLVPATATETPLPTDTDTPASETPDSTSSPTATVTETPVPPTLTPLPEGGVVGQQDMLQVLRQADELPFNPDIFLPLEDGGFRLGTGDDTPGDVLQIRPPLPLLDSAFGNDPARRIRRVESTLTLRTYNPAVIGNDDGGVFFGLMLESVNDGNNIGVQVRYISDDVLELYRVENNDTRFLRQLAVNTGSVVRLRLDRDLVTGDVTLFYNDGALGEPVEFIDANAPVLPVIFAKDGGVVIGINSWRVTLR